jgi:glycosyltransferase involved in cell wall biosynthesis
LKISIVIPTHNRAESLRNAIESVIQFRDEADIELVIVDNNSTDMTKQVVESYASNVKYVFEGNTSFTMARKAGANNSTGDVLLYLDDDVLVRQSSLKNITDVFSCHPDCGAIAGRIDPKFTEEPPAWTLECQKHFNAWSLFNPETIRCITKDFQEVPWAAGPMMAIRRTAYDRVGGFPPDTIGVETNKGGKSFNKLYIGPGDYGLCLKIRNAGFKIYYSNDISVFHVIPPIRFTVGFWRSRLIGEGYQQAIAQRGFFHLTRFRAYLSRFRYQLNFFRSEQKLLAQLENAAGPPTGKGSLGMLSEEPLLLYYKAYLDMDYVLRRHPDLWEFLWEIGDAGVSSKNYDYVIDKLPEEYKELVSSDLVYDSTPVDSLSSYEKTIRGKGYYRKNLDMILDNKMSRRIAINALEQAGKLRGAIRCKAK